MKYLKTAYSKYARQVYFRDCLENVIESQTRLIWQATGIRKKKKENRKRSILETIRNCESYLNSFFKFFKLLLLN